MYPKDSNLFNESFLDTSHTLHSDISPSSCVNQTILTILSRIGFVLVQIGAVPRINVNFIILKNILDICCTTVAYFTLGFVLIFNGDANSLIYGDYYRFKDFLIRKDEFLIGWQAVVIASAIYTSSMVEETHVISHLLVSVLLAGLIQPLLIRWAWISEGWIAKSSLSGVKVVYRDHAGSGIVHVVGGLAGLIISLILSSKKKKTTAKSRNVRKISITSFCTGTLFLGSLLIFISLQNFSMPISEHNVKTTENTIINNLLASCSCSLFVMTLHFTFRQPIDHWTTTKCVQALIAGSVMVSAAADKYSPLMSIALGSSGGTIFYLVSRLMFSSELEDHCNIVATHLVCGFLANLLAPLCIFEIESDTPFVLLNLSWQLISIIIFMGLVIITLTPMLLILDTCDLLRQKSQVFNKKESMNTFVMKKGLSDRNINYDRRTSMINTERLFTMKSSCENDESQNELPQEEESTFPKEDHASTEKNIRNEETSNVSQPSGVRVKKLRHVYTLPGCDFTSPQDRLADGDKINVDLSNNRKHSSETNLQDSKLSFRGIENVNSDNEISLTNNYRLRRTQKFMNLREELDKQEIDGSRQRKESDKSEVDDACPKMISTIFLDRMVDESGL